ncbi:hypothetical protein CIW54_24240 [Paraburkholderia sp. T12-10]|nr:hypothetical protein CIW54_24240 [Paraburkholderia sp. T12-10]
MSTVPPIVTNADDAVAGIHRYNKEIVQLPDDHPIIRNMAYARAWYAVRNADGSFLLGPSKFIGYTGNTATLYADHYGTGDGMDGRTTERALQLFADPIEPGHPLFDELMRTLAALCARFGLTPSIAARLALLPTPAPKSAPPEEGDPE